MALVFLDLSIGCCGWCIFFASHLLRCCIRQCVASSCELTWVLSAAILSKHFGLQHVQLRWCASGNDADCVCVVLTSALAILEAGRCSGIAMILTVFLYHAGIGYSDDKLLQTRIFSYADTQRHRLGPNYLLLPVNAPKCPHHNNHHDGFMNFMHRDEEVSACITIYSGSVATWQKVVLCGPESALELDWLRCGVWPCEDDLAVMLCRMSHMALCSTVSSSW